MLINNFAPTCHCIQQTAYSCWVFSNDYDVMEMKPFLCALGHFVPNCERFSKGFLDAKIFHAFQIVI